MEASKITKVIGRKICKSDESSRRLSKVTPRFYDEIHYTTATENIKAQLTTSHISKNNLNDARNTRPLPYNQVPIIRNKN